MHKKINSYYLYACSNHKFVLFLFLLYFFIHPIVTSLYIIEDKYKLFCYIIFSSKKSFLRFEFFMTMNIKIIVF
jgi:hypothetical protein